MHVIHGRPQSKHHPRLGHRELPGWPYDFRARQKTASCGTVNVNRKVASRSGYVLGLWSIATVSEQQLSDTWPKRAGNTRSCTSNTRTQIASESQNMDVFFTFP